MHSKCLRQSLRHGKPSTDVNIMNLQSFFSPGKWRLLPFETIEEALVSVKIRLDSE